MNAEDTSTPAPSSEPPSDPPAPPTAPLPLSPEQASVVLAADTKNAIRTVREGGTLPAPHRKMMQNLAVTPEAARAARVTALVNRWMSGHDLSAEQRAEVLTVHPEINFATPAPSPETSIETAPAAERAALEAPVAHAAAEQIAAAAECYGTKRRTLFKWLAVGRQRNDPCPLADPAKMAAWWCRNMKHSVPDKIHAAAAKVEKVADQANPRSANGPAPVPPPSLTSTAVVEGEAVQQARQIVGMCFDQLRKALESNPPDMDSAALWQVRWEKSLEALRKQERDDREAQKENREWLPRGPVLAELSQLIESLRIAHMSMGRKVLAELGRQASGRARRVLTLIEPSLVKAIETVRARETDLFASIETLSSPALATQSLAA